jgi:hypothetical protein
VAVSGPRTFHQQPWPWRAGQLVVAGLAGLGAFAATWVVAIASFGWVLGLIVGWWPALALGALAAWSVTGLWAALFALVSAVANPRRPVITPLDPD